MKNFGQDFAGVFTALVTPFRDGQVDFPAFERLVEEQLAAGVAGLVPVGTTGEAATLSAEETDQVIRRTVAVTGGRAFVLAGTGSNNTAHAVHAAKAAEAAGADGCLVVTPYYNKPSQAGLIAHYGAVAEATKLPIILYSVPGRCGVEIAPETAAELAKRHANIIGIKEAGGSVGRVTELRRACGPDFIIHSGDDGLTLPFLSVGASGITSVVSNYAPALVVSLVNAWNEGDLVRARALHEQVCDLSDAMFVEGNPVPVKEALSMSGKISADMRLPLVPLTASNREFLTQTLARFAQA